MGTGISVVTTRAEVSRLVRDSASALGIAVDEVGDVGGVAEVPRIVLVDAGVPTTGSVVAELGPLRPRAAVVMAVHLAGEGQVAEHVAGLIGAQAVVELPSGGPGLRRLLRSDPPGSPSLAVVGAVGGSGATTVAIACAAAAGDALLVDADPWSTGLDLPLGIGPDRGGRWGAIPDTTQPLVAETLRTVLPGVQGITVLTGRLPTPAGARIAAAVNAGRTGFGCVVVDCGRSPSGVPLRAGDPIAIVTPATVAGAVATRRVLDSLDEGVRPALAVRPGGYLPADELAEHLGVRAVLEVPRLSRLPESLECGEILTGRVGRDLEAFGARVWQAVR